MPGREGPGPVNPAASPGEGELCAPELFPLRAGHREPLLGLPPALAQTLLDLREAMPRHEADTGPITLHDFSAQLSGEEWTLLQDWQKELYRNVMKEIHQAMMSLGYKIHGTLLRMNGEETVKVQDVQVPDKREDTPAPISVEPDITVMIIGDELQPLTPPPNNREGETIDEPCAGEPEVSLMIIGDEIQRLTPPPNTKESERIDELGAGEPGVAVRIISDELQHLTPPSKSQQRKGTDEPGAAEPEVSLRVILDELQHLTAPPNAKDCERSGDHGAAESDVSVTIVGDEHGNLMTPQNTNRIENRGDLHTAAPLVQINIKGEVDSFAVGHRDIESIQIINSPTGDLGDSLGMNGEQNHHLTNPQEETPRTRSEYPRPESVVIPNGVQFKIKGEGGSYSENHQDFDIREVIISPSGEPDDSFGINSEETHHGPNSEEEDRREQSDYLIPVAEQVVVPGAVMSGFKEEVEPYVIGHHHSEARGGISASEGDGSMIKRWSFRNSAKCNNESTLFNTTRRVLGTKENHISERKTHSLHQMWPEKYQRLKEETIEQQPDCSQHTYLHKRTDYTQRSDAYHVPERPMSNVSILPSDLDTEQSLSLYSYPVSEQTAYQNVDNIRLRRTPSEQGHYACMCEKEYSARSKPVRHEPAHTGELPYQCTQCGKSFTEKGILIRHLKIHTGVKPHECNKCGKSFSERAVLLRHQKIHTREQPFDCNECGKSFSENRLLIRHHKRHKRTNLNQSTPSGLEVNGREVQIHTGDKSYHCSTCGKNFSQKGVLNRHKQLHTREKPYDCTTCGKSFSEKWILMRHQKIHTREKPSQRPLPVKPLHEKKTVSRNRKVSNGGKSFECTDCGKILSRKDSLVRHQKIHTKEFSFEFAE